MILPWSSHPIYKRFNTADSPKGDHSTEAVEQLDTVSPANSRVSSIAVDGNDIPHVVYQLTETYKGKAKETLTYANRVGAVWNKVAVWPKTAALGITGPISIAIGPNSIPYIMMGGKLLRGNANKATTFETKDLGGGYSFVIHQNGDLRVALMSGSGNYANYLHDHTQSWVNGWKLADSMTPDTGGILVLSDDTPYMITLSDNAIKARRAFEPPVPIASAPSGQLWDARITSRWSYYNHHQPWVIDIGTKSWVNETGNHFWHLPSMGVSMNI